MIETGEVEVQGQAEVGKEAAGPELPDLDQVQVADGGVVPDGGAVIELEGGGERGEIDDHPHGQNQDYDRQFTHKK